MSRRFFNPSLFDYAAVTEQTGAHSCGTLVHDPTISAERNGFY